MMDDFFTRRYKVPLVKGPEDLDAFAYLLQAPTGGYRDLWIRNARKAKAIAQELGLATHKPGACQSATGSCGFVGSRTSACR